MGKKKGGKAPKGRAKQKQKAQQNGAHSQQNSPFHANRRAPPAFYDDDDDSGLTFRGFAQGSSPAGFAARRPNVNLRHQTISFISAGLNTPVRPQDRNLDGAADEEEEEEEDDDDDGLMAVDSSDDDIDIDDSAIQTNIFLESEIDIPNHGIEKMTIATAPSAAQTSRSTAVDVGVAMDNNNFDAQQQPDQAAPAETLCFVVDTVGDESLAKIASAKFKPPPRRAPSPAPSDSSEERVVFSGRARPLVVDDPVSQPLRGPVITDAALSKPHPAPSSAAPPPRGSSTHVTDDLLQALGQLGQGTAPSSNEAMGWAAKTPAAQGDPYNPAATSRSEWTPAPSTPYWKQDSPSHSRGSQAERNGKNQVDTFPVNGKTMRAMDGAEDSIAELQAEWKATLREKRDAKKPSQAPNRRGKKGRKAGNRALKASNLTDEDDDDADGEAAYDDYMQNLIAQMDADDAGSKTTQAVFSANRLQTAEVYLGSSLSDGEAVQRKTKKSSGERNEVGVNTDDSAWVSENSIVDEDEDEASQEEEEDEDSLDESDLEDELEYTEAQQWKDEADLRQRRVDRMTDEQIARLLAKQEELGMEADELLIDDGDYVSMSDGFGDVGAARKGLAQIDDFTFAPSRKVKSGRRRGGGRGGDFFPDASALADTVEQYGEHGFDIMDFDRPSLRPTKKGRKGKLPPELELLSDEELKANTVDAWENDRTKKRQKKLEREELRAEGLLGSAGRKGIADLSQKYRMGMTLAQVHDELRTFMQNDDLFERAFPPMAKADRKALHQVAMALQLESKSRGAGHKRFPVIYKTSRTPAYVDSMFGQVIAASSRGFLRPSKFAKKAAPARGGGTGGGFNKAAVSLRHGEIVGAGAAEIGRESVGHRLMEKMGWTKGMALGKDGEGLLVPVEQKMRIGTAGLG